MAKCLNCGQKTKNPKFCSRSCSAVVNNRLSPKRANTYFCVICEQRCLPKRKFCNDCRSHAKDMTLKKAIYEFHHKSSAYALVRSRARSVMRDKPQSCTKCAYSKHVEVCHIKPISSFDDSTLISVINNEKNLILLCRNCHWEHGHEIGG